MASGTKLIETLQLLPSNEKEEETEREEATLPRVLSKELARLRPDEEPLVVWERFGRPDSRELKALEEWAESGDLGNVLAVLRVQPSRLLRAMRFLRERDVAKALRSFRRDKYVPGRKALPLEEDIGGKGWSFKNALAVEAMWAADVFHGGSVGALFEARRSNIKALEAEGIAYLPLIRCYSCGKILGDLYEPFQLLVPFFNTQRELATARDIRFLWDALGITRYCCMSRLLVPPQLPRVPGNAYTLPGYFPSFPASSSREQARTANSLVEDKHAFYPTSVSVLTRMQYESITADGRSDFSLAAAAAAASVAAATAAAAEATASASAEEATAEPTIPSAVSLPGFREGAGQKGPKMFFPIPTAVAAKTQKTFPKPAANNPPNLSLVGVSQRPPTSSSVGKQGGGK